MNREEWLHWRHKGIGASDSPALMGNSPYKTKLELYEEKILPEPKMEEMNYVQKLGHEWEPRIRELYEFITMQTWEPALIQMDGHEFIKASLDGRSQDKKKIIEIKLLGKDDWNNLTKGIAPIKYMDQVQHQLMVSQSECCIMLGYLYEKGDREARAEKLFAYTIMPDIGHQNKLFGALKEFWAQVQAKTPPLPSDKDYVLLRKPGAAETAKMFSKAKEQIEKWTEIMKDNRERLIGMATHPRSKVGDVKIYQKKGKSGSINYKKVVDEHLNKNIDLEKYRGPSSPASWCVSDKGEEND